MEKRSRLRHNVILCHQVYISQRDETHMLCSSCIGAQIYAWTSSYTPRATTLQAALLSYLRSSLWTTKTHLLHRWL